MNTNHKNPTAHVGGERIDEVRRTAPPSGGVMLWNCQKCGRNRRTNFCQDCGEKKPLLDTKTTQSINQLRLLVAHLRRNTQGMWNAYQTALRRGQNGDISLTSHDKHKRFLDSAEWALSVISQTINSSDSK